MESVLLLKANEHLFLDTSEALLNLFSRLFFFLKLFVFASLFCQVDPHLRLNMEGTFDTKVSVLWLWSTFTAGAGCS